MKVLVSMKVPTKTLESLKECFELDYNDSLIPLSKDQFIDRVKDVDAILCPLSDKIDKDILLAGKNIKIVANFGAGFDNIDIATAKDLGIIVTNTPALHSTSSTAELTMGLIIDIMRGITSGDKDLRAGNFNGWKPTYGLGTSLVGKTLGIVGLGKIGKSLARKAQAFDMKVIYNNRNRLPADQELALGVEYAPFNELLSSSDIVSFHTPFIEELRHIMNYNSISTMKKNSFLINASRGPIIKESDLVKALNEDLILGAALDVYEFEPKISSELLSAKNVLLAPHLGNASHEAREEMGDIAFNNIKLVLEGKPATNQVN